MVTVIGSAAARTRIIAAPAAGHLPKTRFPFFPQAHSIRVSTEAGCVEKPCSHSGIRAHHRVVDECRLTGLDCLCGLLDIHRPDVAGEMVQCSRREKPQVVARALSPRSRP